RPRPAEANDRKSEERIPTETAPPSVDEPPLVIRGQSPTPQTADVQQVWWRRPSQRAQPAPNAPTAARSGSVRKPPAQFGGQSVRATGPHATPAGFHDPRHTVQRQAPPYGEQSAYAAAAGATQSPAYSAGAATTPYTYDIRGQSPGGVANAAYAGLGAQTQSTPQYGGQTVRATGPSSAPIDTQGVQQAQYSSNINPPAGSIAPTPLSPQGPLPPYTLFPDGRFGVPGQPYPEGMVDIYIDGQETQTGRLMLGVGVNSDAGVVGNISIDERNFDWTKYPRSIEDFRNGSAWRGAGQRFRIDASPGSEVQRYLASWQEPYLFDRPVSLGLNASYFDRRYRNWDEQRLGGRISLGYQWVERDLTATLSYRGENINIHDPSTSPGVVPELDEVLGDNVLHGFKLSMINDTRDNPFLATQGHYLQLGGEQVIGTFDYPRVDLDARQYFLLRERPDHSGRHVLSLATNVGYSGTHTPIYDNFFAGGFSTLRGFDFRGASPVINGVEVGGRFQWINSAQYLFPVTADDMLHAVVFCDFGTVERDVEIKDFRVAPGVGLRITVPAMGPAPIALDFAWAVNHAEFDDLEVFAFSLGFSR
ncbi:MAG: BamA/TamA family outer membrane protein, partial [Planctomycetota bacterium]